MKKVLLVLCIAIGLSYAGLVESNNNDFTVFDNNWIQYEMRGSNINTTPSVAAWEVDYTFVGNWDEFIYEVENYSTENEIAFSYITLNWKTIDGRTVKTVTASEGTAVTTFYSGFLGIQIPNPEPGVSTGNITANFLIRNSN